MTEQANFDRQSVATKNNKKKRSGRVLITGGAGFIGSNLSKNLLDEGLEVDCVDNLATGLKSNVEGLEFIRGFRFFECDITTPEFFSAVGSSSYDEIYHLACPTGVPNIEILGEEMLDTCSLGTANVIKMARKSMASVVLTSSCEVYGDPQVFPQAETYTGNVDPRGLRSPYEEGKRFAESYVTMGVRKYGLDAKIVRIFNTYGVGMSFSDQRIIPRFLENGLNGQPLVVFGDGTQTRTFLYVDDNVSALKTVMRDGQAGAVYNVGGSKQVQVKELARMVVDFLPNSVDIEFHPHFIDDHRGREPDTHAMRSLGWAPTIDLHTGLKRMLNDAIVQLPHHASAAVTAASEMVSGL